MNHRQFLVADIIIRCCPDDGGSTNDAFILVEGNKMITIKPHDETIKFDGEDIKSAVKFLQEKDFIEVIESEHQPRGLPLYKLSGKGFEVKQSGKSFTEYYKVDAPKEAQRFEKEKQDAHLKQLKIEEKELKLLKQKQMTFQQNLERIYSVLETKPERRGELETILSQIGIEQNQYTVKEFVTSFKETGHVAIIAESKDGYDIVLTQKGLDYLHSPDKKQPVSVQEIYHNSTVVKGDVTNHSGASFVSGNNNETSSQHTKMPSNSPDKNPPTKKSNSPTGTKQTISLILQVLAIITAVLLVMWANGKLKWLF